MIERFKEDYLNAVFDTDYDQAKQVIKSALDSGITPEDIVFKISLPSISTMLSLYLEKKEATLSQHFLSAKISEEIVDELLPRFKKSPPRRGTVVLGTSFGDFHGLGRKIVAGCLRANMYTVHDLGLNVAAKRFVDEAVRLKADIIGVSSMMVHTAIGDNGPMLVRKILDEKNLNGQIKLIVGGAPYLFDEKMYLKAGADRWGGTALEAVSIVSQLLEEIRK